MLLAKSCHKKDHIKSRNTIKVGTLYEYQTTEIEQIADRHEGKITFLLNFDGRVEIDLDWFNAVFQGNMNFGGKKSVIINGRSKTHTHRLTIVSTNESTAIVQDSSVTIARESLNCFVFCMSEVRKTTECHGMFPEYDSYWHLMSSRVKSFARELGQVLLEQIKENHKKGIYSLPPETDMTDIEIFVQFRKVTYTPREIHFHNESSFSLDDFMNTINDMVFIKPKNYAHEKEFRFHYVIVSRGRIIQPIIKNIILNADRLLPIIM